MGTAGERYQRFANCLTAFHRRTALGQLRDLAGAVGDRLVPAFVAIDLDARRLGRFKLYFRVGDGTPELQALAAEAAGCTRAPKLMESLHRCFLTGPAYPAEAVDISIEFSDDEGEPGFKVDLRTSSLFRSDLEIDVRIRHLIQMLGAPEEGYGIARDIVVGAPTNDQLPQIVFAGVASRRNDYQLDTYFHPVCGRPPIRCVSPALTT